MARWTLLPAIWQGCLHAAQVQMTSPGTKHWETGPLFQQKTSREIKYLDQTLLSLTLLNSTELKVKRSLRLIKKKLYYLIFLVWPEGTSRYDLLHAEGDINCPGVVKEMFAHHLVTSALYIPFNCSKHDSWFTYSLHLHLGLHACCSLGYAQCGPAASHPLPGGGDGVNFPISGVSLTSSSSGASLTPVFTVQQIPGQSSIMGVTAARGFLTGLIIQQRIHYKQIPLFAFCLPGMQKEAMRKHIPYKIIPIGIFLSY